MAPYATISPSLMPVLKRQEGMCHKEKAIDGLQIETDRSLIVYLVLHSFDTR